MMYNGYQPEKLEPPTKKFFKKTEHLYKTIYSFRIHELDKSVNLHLEKGWRLVGQQYAVESGAKRVYLQPMEKIETKYESPVGPE